MSFSCVCGAVLCCASCCSVPVASALLLVPRAVVCPCVLWCLPGRSAVSWCRSGVSWGLGVLCVVLCELRPVLFPAVLCCLAVLCWCAVLCRCLRCWCLFFLLSSFPLLNTPAVFPCQVIAKIRCWPFFLPRIIPLRLVRSPTNHLQRHTATATTPIHPCLDRTPFKGMPPP